MTESYLKPKHIDIGQVWEDDQGTVRQVFSIWRGDVTYGFVRKEDGAYGSCSTPVWRFVELYAKTQRFDIGNIELLFLDTLEAIAREVNKERIEEGLNPIPATFLPEYPRF